MRGPQEVLVLDVHEALRLADGAHVGVLDGEVHYLTLGCSKIHQSDIRVCWLTVCPMYDVLKVSWAFKRGGMMLQPLQSAQGSKRDFLAAATHIPATHICLPNF